MLRGLEAAVERLGGFGPMVLPAAGRVELERQFGIGTDQLLPALSELVKRRAVAPISGFEVGAAGLGNSGRVFFGVNMEFIGDRIGQTVHGEQFMLANAFNRAETGIKALAVNAAPCGHCRQFLNELPEAGSIKVMVDQEQWRLSQLLPASFGPADLGSDTRLLDALDHQLLPLRERDETDRLLMSAVRAANRSYSPYTGSPSGVALEVDGESYSGGYVESAAYNPSLPPLQVALVALHTGGIVEFGRIERAVLVEQEQAPVQQHAGTKELLRVVAPEIELERVLIGPKP